MSFGIAICKWEYMRLSKNANPKTITAKGRWDGMSYVFRQSNENEVLALTKMSEAAFNSDKEFGGTDGGPTGYDNYDFHMNHFLEGNLFSLLNDDKLVAGAILKLQDNDLYIYRIFVDSAEFHKGHGIDLMKAIE